MKKAIKIIILFLAFMFISSLVVHAELAKDVQDVEVQNFERVTPCSMLQFDTGESNYLVAKSGSNFVVWTSYALNMNQKQQFVTSFLIAAVLAGDGGPFGNITVLNVIAWLSEDTVYNGGDIVITTIDNIIEMTFGAPSAWAQWAKGNLSFIDPEITISVRKVWSAPSGTSLPTSIIARVMNGAVEVDRVTLNSSNNWKHIFTLPKYDDADEIIIYTVEEAVVPTNFTVSVTVDTDLTNPADYMFVITNTYNAPPPGPGPEPPPGGNPNPPGGNPNPPPGPNPDAPPPPNNPGTGVVDITFFGMSMTSICGAGLYVFRKYNLFVKI